MVRLQLLAGGGLPGTVEMKVTGNTNFEESRLVAEYTIGDRKGKPVYLEIDRCRIAALDFPLPSDGPQLTGLLDKLQAQVAARFPKTFFERRQKRRRTRACARMRRAPSDATAPVGGNRAGRGIGDAARARERRGPVTRGDTESSIRGGLVPRQKTTVRLRAAELTIAIDPDGDHYDISAKYLLSNPDAETTVRFGVPLLFEPDRPKAAQQAADAVRIKVGDRASRCALLKETVTLDANVYEDLEVTPARRLVRRAADDSAGRRRSDACSPTVAICCCGTNPAPRARSSASGGAMLRYVFFPAGHWLGPAERVAVTVDLGRFAGLEQVVSPPGAVRQGDKLTWTFTNVDLKKVPDLAAESGGRHRSRTSPSWRNIAREQGGAEREGREECERRDGGESRRRRGSGDSRGAWTDRRRSAGSRSRSAGSTPTSVTAAGRACSW